MENDIVKIAKERFKRAKEFYSDQRTLANDDTKFAMGDSDNLWQWPEESLKERTTSRKVCLTVNLTAQHCNQIINNIRINRPSVKVSPVDNGADIKTAEILSGLIRNIQVSSSSDGAHDTAAEMATYGGEGYWRIITEYEDELSFDQVIVIKPCPNPNLVYIDPDCKELDRSDAEWGFIFEDVAKEKILRDHPDLKPESWEDSGDSDWTNDNTIRRAEYFYCEYKDDVSCMMPDGFLALKSELSPEEYETRVNERPTRIKSWKWCKLVGGHDEPIDERDWLGKYLPIISVVGKEINVDGEVVRKGIVRDLKDSARIVNYSYSESVQTVALQNKVPYVAAAESIEGYEDFWKTANLENLSYLPFNAFDEAGNQLPTPARQPAAVLPAAQMSLLQMSIEQMRGASGQQSANFGIRSEAASGVGIQRLQQQGDIATFHFPDNLARGLNYEAKVLIDLVQKYYDTERVIRILGIDGKEDKVRLNPEMEEPYQEQEDDRGEIQKIFNPSVGRYDVTIDTGPSYQTQRQEAADNLNALSAKNPNLMAIAGDLIMQAQDFPMADKLAERLAKTIPPELKDDDGKGEPQIPPQLTQQLQQMGQVIEQLKADNAKLTLENQSNRMDNEVKLKIADQNNMIKAMKQEQDNLIDKFEAETKRISAVKEEITPEMVKSLVMEVLQSTNSTMTAS